MKSLIRRIARKLGAGFFSAGASSGEDSRDAERLARQNSLLNTLLENFPGGISLCDADLRVVALNTRFKTLLDLPDELMNREKVMFEDVIRFNAQRGEYGDGDVEEIVAAGVARARKFEAHHFERMRPNGVVLEVRGVPLPGGGFVSLYIDITERKKIEQQLANQKEHLEELVQQRTRELSEALALARRADQTKDAFLANMSHELRTPLNAVIGLASLARNTATEPRQRDYLDKIVSSGAHLNRIINDLLDLSKIAAGHMEFEVVAFRLHGLLERCESVMEHRAAEKGLQLAATIDPAVPDILLGDPHRLEQILLNLLGNAIKFTANGRIDIRAGLVERKEGRICLDIEVQDTGIGMRAEDLERLFVPFSQVDATVSRQFGGTGLGLAISRRLAEMMGGDIRVSSREGIGTVFRVRLWLGEGAEADLPVAEHATEADLPVGYHDVRILVVEDQPLNREIVEALLTAVGIVPLMTENGREALDVLDAEGPAAFDLVLMDIQMPVMDGLAATRELRRRDGFGSLPIIAMTAHTMEHEKEISAAAGMNDHIGKPFDNASFYRTLARWIPLGKQKFPRRPESPAPEVSVAGGNALGALGGVDVAAALARFGGREDRYRHWLKDFMATAAAIPGTIRTQAAGNRDEAAKTAHAFKGRVGMLGMTELHGTVSALEAALRAGASSEELLAELEASIGRMREQLARVLGAGA